MKAFIKENGFPILLSTTVLSGGAYIYCCGVGGVILGFIVFSLVYSSLIFGMFEFFRKKDNKILSAVGTAAFCILSLFAAVLSFDTDGNTLFKWFLEPSDFNQVYPGNITALILCFGCVLGGGIYYFTRIRYRAVYIFLIIICPFALFAKTFTVIPVIYTIILVTLFFIIMIYNNSSITFGTGSGFYGTVGIFMVIVTLAASFFPKLEYAPYREEFDELITDMSIGGAGKADYNSFSDTSATGGSDDETVLYRIYGDNPERIRRQCFNKYDASKNVWGYYGDMNNGRNAWRRFLHFEYTSDFANKAGYKGSDIESTTYECKIESLDSGFHAVYLTDDLTVLRTNGKEVSDSDIYRTELDEYFVGTQVARKLKSYELVWAETEYNEEFSKTLSDEYIEKRRDSWEDNSVLNSYLLALKDAEKHNDYLLSEAVRKSCYRSEESYLKVKALTEEITEGKSSDYEKAAAIEAYFLSPLFVYDDKFTPADSSIENFIFNTRRGSCIKYATAMTLMCREAGLTARYVEGFLVNKRNAELDCYEVMASNAHSYVQVWIDGYGWTDFDPTSNIIDDGYFDETFAFVGITALVIGIAILAVIVIRPLYKEKRFRKALRNSRGRNQAVMLYGKIVSSLEAVSDTELGSLTSEEITKVCADSVGLDISDFTEYYRASVYGGKNTSEVDFYQLYIDFRESVKKTLKERRKRK